MPQALVTTYTRRTANVKRQSCAVINRNAPSKRINNDKDSGRCKTQQGARKMGRRSEPQWFFNATDTRLQDKKTHGIGVKASVQQKDMDVSDHRTYLGVAKRAMNSHTSNKMKISASFKTMATKRKMLQRKCTRQKINPSSTHTP